MPQISGSGAVGTPRLSPTPTDRYSLAGGCYTLRSASAAKLVTKASGGEYVASASHASDAYPIYMRATALGQYLVYGAGADFVTANAQGGVSAGDAPSEPAVWRVDQAGTGFFTLSSGARALAVDAATGRLVLAGSADAAGTAARFAFQPASGCASYPEAQVNAHGTPPKGASPMAEVKGTADPHTHITAFEFIGGDFHCGRPWHPFGVAYALPDCASIQGPQGNAAPIQNFLDYGEPVHPHDTKGWDTFRDWPGPDKLTYENTYYTGLKRAWLAGLRVIVTDLVDNEALCDIMVMKHNPCHDMNSVRIQSRDLFALQDYIDAQSGGPGKGFFRVVTDPFHARTVINQGKLAVVQGIELSRIFDCGEQNGVAECGKAQVDSGLAEIKALGVSSFYPVHKFDNAFGGTKMDGGEVGAVVNAGNHLKTNHFWDVKTCDGPAQDSQQLTAPDATVAALLAGPASGLLGGGTVPLYAPGAHCNQRGLTDLGAYLLHRMIEEHYIIEVDHMDVKTADQALSVIEAARYSGIISPHSWTSPEQYKRIYDVGGFVNPIAHSSPKSFIKEWQADKKLANPKYYFGFGYGSDSNGLASQGAPTAANPIRYPFKSFDGAVTFDREQWGQRTYDLNQDGVANYGLYADWLEELHVLGGSAFTTDMYRGAESYLQMWERAYGVSATHCRPARESVTPSGLGAVHLGDGVEKLLMRAGQPASRPGRSYRYCVGSASSGSSRFAAVFNSGGFVTLIASTAGGDTVSGLGPGASLRTVRRRAKQLDRTLWLGGRTRSGARFVYGVSGGKVRFVAVASAAAARSLKQLRSDLSAAGLS